MAPAINFIDLDFKDIGSELIDNSSKCFAEFNIINYKKARRSNINYLALYIRQPFNLDELINQIPNDLFLLMQQGIVRPLIIMSTEQWDLFDTYAWEYNKVGLTPDFGNVPYSKTVHHFTARSVPEENITWLVPTNSHIDQISFLEKKGYKIKTKFLQYDYFLQMLKPIANEHEIKARSFKKYFSSLCKGTPRNHRYGMTYSLWNNMLVDKGNVSCEDYQELEESKKSNWIDDTVTTSSFMNGFENWSTNKNKFIENLPLNYDNKNNQHWMSNYDESYIFNDSFLWISSETKKTHEGVYITEKTWKAIAYGSPFCINGDNGSLRYLKSMGFKTFSEYWDESYDEDNDIEKIKKITNIVKNICDKSLDELHHLYASMLPILKHNQQLLANNTQHNNLIKDLSKAYGIESK